jgi:predicted acetyltransferase
VELADPHPRFHRSFLAAADEFLATGDERYAGLHSMPAEGDFPGVDFTREGLEDPEVFAALVRFLLGQREEATPRPRAYVPFTDLWMADGDEFLGRISLRHELNAVLHEWGGHIGYSVRPSARRRGHATAALEAMLRVCAERGIDPVLVTCDSDNVASRRTIERAGGVYEDTRDIKLRYWVPARR